jgi:hypothetical protein
MIAQGQCTVFKKNLLNGLENFTTGVYKIALYTALADLSNTTTAYTTSNEVSGAGYTAGGRVLVNIPPASDTSNNTAYISFNNVTWTGASFTCRGALIYNGSTNAAVCVLDFGSDKVASGSFTVTFPTATSTTAVLTIS